jgi:hypothetical protein
MSDNDPSDDRNIVSEHVKNFVQTGRRSTADELAGSFGGLVEGVAGVVAEGLANKIADIFAPEDKDDDKDR